MSATVEQITEDALSLSGVDRALLVDRLVESPDPADDDELKASWAEEALRRRDEVRSGAVKTIPA
jgi:hypothetical protein